MSKPKTIIKNWPKYLLQWGVLIAIIVHITGLIKTQNGVDPEAYCPMGGLQALSTWLAQGSLPCSMSSVQILMGLALILATILLSKLFCAFLCPIGTVEDILAKIRRKLHLKGIKIRSYSLIDKVLRIIKYVLVFWIFYMTVSSSELFCKKLDPYYAVATGFKGEIILWMSIITVGITILAGFFIDRFWCRYICPLGAISNSFKFWIWTGALFLIYYLLIKSGVAIPWWVLLALFCTLGYILEICYRRPKAQILYMMKDADKCNHCGVCTKYCPYHIDINSFNDGRINSVDCTLCSECAAVCRQEALNIGFFKSRGSKWLKTIPAILTVILFVIALQVGKDFEIPTIDETWGNAPEKVETTMVEGLRSVKCYGSSKAFKARLEKIPGIYGVKTYVKHHRALITYDPKLTNPEKIQSAIYVPSKFRVATPNIHEYDSLKVITIRTEKMYDKMDINYVGLQMRQMGKKIYGLESEFACPLILRVYVAPNETLTDDWFKKVIELKKLEMPQHGGGTKTIDVDFKFVKMEDDIEYISTEDYIRKMFSPFKAEFASRVKDNEGKQQYIYEISDPNYEKPIVLRNMPFLSNHLSREEGIIGIYLELNDKLEPSIRIRYASPMSSERVWELITLPTWTITYSKDDIREIPAKFNFKTPGKEIKL